MTAEAKSDMIDRLDRIIRTRIDELGVEEPIIQKVGGDRLIVQLAGQADEERAKSIVTDNAFLEFKLVEPITERGDGTAPDRPRDRRRARRRLDTRARA